MTTTESILHRLAALAISGGHGETCPALTGPASSCACGFRHTQITTATEAADEIRVLRLSLSSVEEELGRYVAAELEATAERQHLRDVMRRAAAMISIGHSLHALNELERVLGERRP